MSQAEFRDALAKLRFIDRQEWMSEAFWRLFREDPFRGFLKADDEQAAKLWDLIKP